MTNKTIKSTYPKAEYVDKIEALGYKYSKYIDKLLEEDPDLNDNFGITDPKNLDVNVRKVKDFEKRKRKKLKEQVEKRKKIIEEVLTLPDGEARGSGILKKIRTFVLEKEPLEIELKAETMYWAHECPGIKTIIQDYSSKWLSLYPIDWKEVKE